MNKSFYLTQGIFETLLNDRMTHLGKFIEIHGISNLSNRFSINDHELPIASAYLMGGSKRLRRIKKLIKLKPEGGCGTVPLISPDQFCEAMNYLIKEDYEIVGIARVGAFRIRNTENQPWKNFDTYRDYKLFQLSVGRDGFLMEQFGYKKHYSVTSEFEMKIMKGK